MAVENRFGNDKT